MAETYPLVLREGRWWLPYGLEVDAEQLAGLFMADASVVFLGPQGGSLAWGVDEEGEERIRLDYGAWKPAASVPLSDWQQGVFRLIREALEQM